MPLVVPAPDLSGGEETDCGAAEATRALSTGARRPPAKVLAMSDDNLEDRIRAMLQPTAIWYERVLSLRDATPEASSAYVDDAQQPLSRYARQGASAALTAAMDHLFYWASLFLEAGRQPGAAHFTLMRGALEGAAITRWILDPSVDGRVRIARGIGHYLEDLRERRIIEDLAERARLKGGDDTPKDWHEGKPARDRIRELEEEAAVVGLAPVRATRTELVDKHGPGETIYRIACAFAHAGQGIPLAASVVRVRRGPGEDRIAELSPNMEFSERLTRLTGDSVLTAIRRTYAYYGLDASLDDFPRPELRRL